MRRPPIRRRWRGERTLVVPGAIKRRGAPLRPSPRAVAALLRERRWHTP
jgi:hypothetical protein